MVTINKTRSSCVKAKLLVDIKANLPEHVRMDIEDEQTEAIRIEKVEIQYDYLPKYYKEWYIREGKGQKAIASEGKKKEESQRINSQPQRSGYESVGRIIREENTREGEKENQDTEVQGEGKTPIRPELSTSEEKEVEVAHISTSECSATLGDKPEKELEDLESYKANSPNKTLHEIVSGSRIKKEKGTSQIHSSRMGTEVDINSEVGTYPNTKGSKKIKVGTTGDQIPMRILPKRGLKPIVK
ncbi:hypothetical protein HAX54_006680 [Datura stramonium]|uniref:Uncharacterized protein n=1 Tax=Datura stramonium TaxID=4076 RepID=A0ABS8WZ41_DATST|nr:hypothetical protein [Datura stramonium]